jgi:hypothetical protein
MTSREQLRVTRGTSRILDRGRKIIELVWTGRETPADVEAVNLELLDWASQLGRDFDLLVDMRSVTAWSQETKDALVAHQQLLIKWGMRRASVVVASAVARLQLKGVKQLSSNDRETQWGSYEEALAFLKEA